MRSWFSLSLRWIAALPMSSGLAMGAFAIAAILLIGGAGYSQELGWKYVRDGWRQHAPSGEIAIVEIDARSIEQLDSWPWPRRYHAQLIDRLRAAKVRSLAFDVDFSSRSTADDDAAFARALKAYGGDVVLPTFRQQKGGGYDGAAESLPIDIFRQNSIAASVNVIPDKQGAVTRQPYGIVTDGVPRPSLAAAVAETQGAVDRSFPIDLAIDSTAIPRFSFVDVVNGRFDPAALADKRVIIGATAIEMGDRYYVPLHGVIPGVVIQALASETLLADGVLPDLGGFPLLALAGLIAWFALRRSFAKAITALLLAIPLIGALLPFEAETAGIATFDVMPALGCLVAAAILRTVVHLASSFRAARFVDVESGLPNGTALLRAMRSEDDGGVVAMTIGHFGDIASLYSGEDRTKLLQAIAARVDIGSGGVPIHRIDSATFAWRIDDPDGERSRDMIKGIAALFAARLTVAGREVLIQPFFGLADCRVSPTPSLMVAGAVQAALSSASSGRLFTIQGRLTAEMSEAKMTLIADIDRALREGELRLVYQPKCRIADSQFAGAEALVRWDHPTRGPISPTEFVPIIESEGMQARLAQSVLDIALRDIAVWASAGHQPQIAINLSANLFADESVIDDLLSRITLADLAPDQLAIEVTESAIISDEETTVRLLDRFRAVGCPIAIDDYGTGQSTLTYLKKLPADYIKIDQSFVRNIDVDAADRIMVRSTIEMAHALGFMVIAEGVETQPIMDILSELQCDFAQGWLIARPLEAGQLQDWNRSVRSAAA